MLRVRVQAGTIRQLENLKRSANAFKRQIEDRENPLKKIKRRQIMRWAQNFSSEGGIYGDWPALSDTWTIPEREDQGYGAGPKLFRVGTLFTHFTDQNEDGTVDNQAVQWNFSNMGGPRGFAGSTVSHHTGYPNPIPGRAAIPSRILWDLDPDDDEAAHDIMEDWIDRVVARYF
jgi:hypothetical protein